MAETVNRPPMQVGTGEQADLNIAASKVVKAGPGRVAKVAVLVAGAIGAIHDAPSVAAATTANRIAIVPAAVGVVQLDWPFSNGLVYVPGAAQVVSICYS